MTYEHRHVARQKVKYNSTNTECPLTYQLVVNGAKVTPTSATITIYAPGGTTALVSAAAMTLSGTKLTYSPTTTTVASWPIGSGYKAEIAVTYSTVVYNRVVMFDVVKYLLDTNIGIDQLRALDDSIQGMQHVDDEDFSELIEACRDQLQVKIESKVLGDGKLVENMILDTSRIGAVHVLLCLYQIHFNKGNTDKAAAYKERFDDTLPAVLDSIQYDKAQDGFEDAEIGGVTECRLVT